MKKKAIRKLALNRETLQTLQTLQENQVGPAYGGGTGLVSCVEGEYLCEGSGPIGAMCNPSPTGDC